MKQAEILQVIGKELGSTDLSEINRLLRGKNALTIKYRIYGKKLRHLGYTVAVKMIAADGVRIFDVNKVILLKFEDIDSFTKAPPKEKREKDAATIVKPPAKKKAAPAAAAKARASSDDDEAFDDDDEYDDDDLENFDEVDTELAEAAAAAAKPKRSKVQMRKGGGDKGSKFIPAKSRKP